jgi:hypothetical protein
MIWARHIGHMGDEIYTNFRFKTLSRRGHLVGLRLDGGVSKIAVRDAGCEDVNSIELFQDRVLRVVNLLV